MHSSCSAPVHPRESLASPFIIKFKLHIYSPTFVFIYREMGKVSSLPWIAILCRWCRPGHNNDYPHRCVLGTVAWLVGWSMELSVGLLDGPSSQPVPCLSPTLVVLQWTDEQDTEWMSDRVEGRERSLSVCMTQRSTTSSNLTRSRRKLRRITSWQRNNDSPWLAGLPPVGLWAAAHTAAYFN